MILSKGKISTDLLHWKTLLKVFLSIGILYLLYTEIFANREITQLTSVFIEAFDSSRIWCLVLVVFLMPANWILESLKWKKLTSYFINISIIASLKMIVVGLTFGILTPSRIGEYGGRFYMMKEGSKWKAISATFIGSLAQNIVTGSVGLIGASYLFYQSPPINQYLLSSYFYIISLIILAGLLVYFRIGLLAGLMDYLPSSKYKTLLKQHSSYLKNIRWSDLNAVLGMSLGRYMVYGLQYYLLLQFYGIDVSFSEGSGIIALLFLIQSGLPLPPLIGVMARGEIAITVWSLYTANTLGILATTFSLWLINLIIPVLVGLVLVLRRKDK